MSDPDHDPRQVVFRVYGLDVDEIRDEAFDPGCTGNKNGYDHDAAEAATLCMKALQERFDWADDITGVAMGWTED